MAEHGHISHGNSPAAWSCVGLLMVAAAIFTLAVILTSVVLAVIGGVLTVVALVLGKVLSLAGYGANPPANPRVPRGVR